MCLKFYLDIVPRLELLAIEFPDTVRSRLPGHRDTEVQLLVHLHHPVHQCLGPGSDKGDRVCQVPACNQTGTFTSQQFQPCLSSFLAADCGRGLLGLAELGAGRVAGGAAAGPVLSEHAELVPAPHHGTVLYN